LLLRLCLVEGPQVAGAQNATVSRIVGADVSRIGKSDRSEKA
jgi:hypothetical protein